jgi:mono/diheme cytochrome c family protein
MRHPLFFLAVVLVTAAGPARAAGPAPNTAASIEAGRVLFARYCTECHGADGRARVDVIANATDLTEPELYLNGTGIEDVFRSIDEGAGVAMPAWGAQLGSSEEVWQLVNFVRSLWPQEQRPAVVE